MKEKERDGKRIKLCDLRNTPYICVLCLEPKLLVQVLHRGMAWGSKGKKKKLISTSPTCMDGVKMPTRSNRRVGGEGTARLNARKLRKINNEISGRVSNQKVRCPAPPPVVEFLTFFRGAHS